jgi:hypothetical protein
MSWARSNLKTENKKIKTGPGLDSAGPNYFYAKGVFGNTHPYTFSFYFSSLCFDIWPNEFFLNIRKF